MTYTNDGLIDVTRFSNAMAQMLFVNLSAITDEQLSRYTWTRKTTLALAIERERARRNAGLHYITWELAHPLLAPIAE